MQILVIGDPEMTLGGIWSKIIFLQILAFLTPIMGIFDRTNFGHGRPPNDWEQNKYAHFCIFDPHPQYAHFVHGRPTNDIWGHLDQNGSLPAATL